MGKVVMLVTNACALTRACCGRRAGWWRPATRSRCTLDRAGTRPARNGGRRQRGAASPRRAPLWRKFRHAARPARLPPQRAPSLRGSPPDLVVCHDADTLPLARGCRRRALRPCLTCTTCAPGPKWRTQPARPALRQPLAGATHTQGLPHADLIVTTSGAVAEGAVPASGRWRHGAVRPRPENRPDEGTFRPATPDGTWRVACLGRVLTWPPSTCWCRPSLRCRKTNARCCAGRATAWPLKRLGSVLRTRLEVEVEGPLRMRTSIGCMTAWTCPLRSTTRAGATSPTAPCPFACSRRPCVACRAWSTQGC